MSVEAVLSLGAAWMARSRALLGFGGDSAVALLSAAVVLWRFYSTSREDHAERAMLGVFLTNASNTLVSSDN